MKPTSQMYLKQDNKSVHQHNLVEAATVLLKLKGSSRTCGFPLAGVALTSPGLVPYAALLRIVSQSFLEEFGP